MLPLKQSMLLTQQLMLQTSLLKQQMQQLLPLKKHAMPLMEGQVMVSSNVQALGGLVRGIREDDIKALPLVAGNVRLGTNLDIAVFDQARSTLDFSMTLLAEPDTVGELRVDAGASLVLAADIAADDVVVEGNLDLATQTITCSNDFAPSSCSKARVPSSNAFFE